MYFFCQSYLLSIVFFFCWVSHSALSLFVQRILIYHLELLLFVLSRYLVPRRYPLWCKSSIVLVQSSLCCHCMFHLHLSRASHCCWCWIYHRRCHWDFCTYIYTVWLHRRGFDRGRVLFSVLFLQLRLKFFVEIAVVSGIGIGGHLSLVELRRSSIFHHLILLFVSFCHLSVSFLNGIYCSSQISFWFLFCMPIQILLNQLSCR